MTWVLYSRLNEKEREIVARRFGSLFPDRPPCAKPDMLECAHPECQFMDRCQFALQSEPCK